MEKYKLKDICQVVNGRAYKQVELLQEGKYKVLRVGNFFTSDRWYYSDMELDENKYCDNDDLLYAWSASFGPRLWEGDKTIYHYHIWKMIPDPLKVNKYYLYYWLLNNANQLTAGTHGSVMAHITKNSMENQNIELPNLDIQFKVSDMLHTIDEKIKTNEKINRNLSDQANALYKSWFVDFDPFNAEMPCDWKMGTVEDLAAEIVCGKTPSTKKEEYYGEDVPFVTIPDMHGCVYTVKTERWLSRLGAESQSKKTLPKNSICVSCIGTAGLVVLLSKDSQTNQQINSIIPKMDYSPYYIYLMMVTMSETINKLGQGGSTIVNLNKTQFGKMEVLIPSVSVMKNFDELVEPFFSAILSNQYENMKLVNLRDGLLPRLMSGELDVSELEL